MTGADLAALPIIPPDPSVRFVLGHRTKKSMSQKTPRGEVKVYRDKHRCWNDAEAEFGKKIAEFDVFGMDQAAWDVFRAETKHVEVDGEQAIHPDQGVVG